MYDPSDEMIENKARYATLMDDYYNEHRSHIEETPLSPINGFPGYFVDYLGNIVKSVDEGFRFVKPWKGQNGYLYVDLIDEYGEKKKCLLHRIVAEAFVDNPEGHKVVRHYDDCPLNNSVSNLKWGTQHDNHNDMFRNGHDFHKEVYCYETDTTYRSCAIAAEALGCSRSAITRVCTGRNRSINGYHLCYEADKEDRLSNLDEWLKEFKRINPVHARNLETDEELYFDNYTEAANHIGCTVGSISQIMHGKNYSCKGWTFW